MFHNFWKALKKVRKKGEKDGGGAEGNPWWVKRASFLQSSCSGVGFDIGLGNSPSYWLSNSFWKSSFSAFPKVIAMTHLKILSAHCLKNY